MKNQELKPQSCYAISGKPPSQMNADVFLNAFICVHLLHFTPTGRWLRFNNSARGTDKALRAILKKIGV